MNFFKDLREENIGGVAYKNFELKKRIIGYFATVGNATIPDLAKEINLSVPKVTTLLNELTSEGLARDYGKLDSTGGRRPSLYGLESESGFFLGVEVKRTHINIGLLDFKENLLKFIEKVPYQLKNTQESLDQLCDIINTTINGLPVPKMKILGLGLNLTGRVNNATGYSYSFFHFHEEPLSRIIETAVGIKTYIENDSRAMAYGEFSSDVVSEEKNVLFINFDQGIGLGILIDGQLYYGKSGYAGEFGHIPIFENDTLCHCGKKGCLETEASGHALVTRFRQKVAEGLSSSILSKVAAPEEITLEHIIEAALNDDTLAIELIGETSEKLGRGIALLINLYNPELIIIGGALAATGDYVILPMKSSIKKYSLSILNNDTRLKLSRLKEKAGVIGACLLVRNRIISI
ncbi:MAG TPA: ROK family transcriptional regulator [Chitinophagaceae bacterium]